MFLNYVIEDVMSTKEFLNKMSEGNNTIILCGSLEENKLIILEPIITNTISVMETQISTKGFKDIPSKKNKYRYIMIDNGAGAKHGARMKVSKYNSSIGKNNNNYISLGLDNNDKDIIVVGDCKSIDMDNRELELYKDLLLRNKNLVKLAKDPSKMDDCNNSLKYDEALRSEGIIVERDKDGVATVYCKNKPYEIDYKLSLKGDKIE